MGKLEKINAKDLLFSGDLQDDRVNCLLTLNDSDWMDYKFQTGFRTWKMGELQVNITYCGTNRSEMVVKQYKDRKATLYRIMFPTEVFYDHCRSYLNSFLSNLVGPVVFEPEAELLSFYNDILDSGIMESKRDITDMCSKAFWEKQVHIWDAIKQRKESRI